MPAPLRILNLALALIHTSNGKTRAELMGEISGYGQANPSTARRSFERDLEHLRRLGLVVEVRDRFEEATYRIRRSSLGAAEPFLSERELALLLRGAGLWSDEGSAAETLRNKLRGYTRGPVAAERPTTQYELSDGDRLEAISKAIGSHSCISFLYLSRKRERLRRVLPWKVVVRGRSLYVWGFDLDEQQARLYRLSRFLSPPRVLDEAVAATLAIPDSEIPFAPTQFLVAPLLWVDKDGGPESRSHSEFLAQKGAGTICRGEEDDVTIWEQRALREADTVEVLEPEWLREAIERRLRAAATWEEPRRG